MRHALLSGVMAGVFCALPCVCQETGSKTGPVPIYRVTVVERNVYAVNYQYRSGPTKIDFRGTVLLSEAKGDATVESQRGRTEIDAKFEKLAPATRFGREYLTYVLWAISPEGAPYNLGEVVPNGGNDARLHVTTDLQAFGMIVTAEPYSAVRQPSDVVVLENQVRPDTVGRSAPIQAKYELMPRGQYTWQVEVDAQQARIDADAARAQADSERAARSQAEAAATAERQRAAQADRLQAVIIEPPRPQRQDRQAAQTQLRIQLLERLNGLAATRDTPRGLVVTLADGDFSGASLSAAASNQVARVAAVAASQPGLHVAVDGHSETAGAADRAAQRATAVRGALVSAGLPANAVTSQGFGNSRPIGAGLSENRRVEIVISGDPIGTLPFWDRTYSLNPK